MSSLSRLNRGPIGRFALVLVVLAVLPGAGAAPASADEAETVYTSQQTIPVPPASTYMGGGGGDGWDIALSSTAVYNVFHHSGSLTVACHLQSDASACWTPKTITDDQGGGFATPGHSSLRMDRDSGRLFTFATRLADNTGGVVCIDTERIESAAFCGFTPLTGVGASVVSGYSPISSGVELAGRFYAFNYTPGAGSTSGSNSLLCFDLADQSPCPGQPYGMDTGGSGVANSTSPSPAIAAIGTRIIVPIRDSGGADRLACFDSAAGTSCSGAWPVSLSIGFSSQYGAPFALLEADGSTVGVCLPTGSGPCFGLSGEMVAAPQGLWSAIRPTSGWNGSSLTLGTRVLVPNGRYNSVDCYDFGAQTTCPGYPRSLSNLSLLYTVNPDPDRPTCLWVNSDNGTGQIQNFDAYTTGPCGEGPIRVLASSSVVETPLCRPASFTSLQVLVPTPTEYTSGWVAFQDGNANPVAGADDRPLDGTGSVDLGGLGLETTAGLPHFLITLDGVEGGIGEVVVQLSWTGGYNESCLKPGTEVNPPETECRDVRFFGVRGSGQTSGMGPQVWSLHQWVDKVLPHWLDMDYVEVNYPAAGVPAFDGLRRALSPKAWGDFLGSAYQGKVNLFYQVNKWAEQCPNERLIIAGYSQGAMAVHNNVFDLYFDRPGIWDRVDAFVLIADGYRHPNDRTTHYGTAPNSAAGVGFMFSAGDFPKALFAKPWANKIIDLCNEGDMVCDAPSVDVDVHTSTYTDSGIVAKAAVKAATNVCASHPSCTVNE